MEPVFWAHSEQVTAKTTSTRRSRGTFIDTLATVVELGLDQPGWVQFHLHEKRSCLRAVMNRNSAAGGQGWVVVFGRARTSGPGTTLGQELTCLHDGESRSFALA